MKEIIQKQTTKIFSNNRVAFAYLFGSQARGKIGRLSDIDIAIYFSKNISAKNYFENRLKVMGELMDLYKRNDVDVVLLNEAPPLLAHRILKEGRLIFSSDEKARIDYEVKAVLKYLDWKPYLEKYTKEVFGAV